MQKHVIFYTLVLFFIGCSCIPPESKNHIEEFKERFTNVRSVTGLDAPDSCLYVQLVESETFMCGNVNTDGCFSDKWPNCPTIRISIHAVETSAVEHEYLHYLFNMNGQDDPDHTWRTDFSKLEYKAYGIYQETRKAF